MKNYEIVNVQADGCCGNDRYLDGSRTVNGVLATFPSTSEVFNRFGVDVCCGEKQQSGRRDSNP